MPYRLVCAVLCLGAVCGCTAEAAVAADAGGPTSCEPARKLEGDTPLPADVDDVLESMCRECHGAPLSNYAPMPLLTWEDLQAPAPSRKDGSAVYERMAVRIHDAKFPMPPITRPQLSDAQRAVLDDWIAQCAPPAND